MVSQINAQFFIVKTFKGHQYVFFMRPPVCRHVLVKIRNEIGYQQKELADLVECSTSAIKRIELCSLALSRRLAHRMSEALGVSTAYLLKNDLRRSPITEAGEPWTREVFEQLPAKNWRNLDPYERVWKLLYSGMLLSRFEEYAGMINSVPNPLEAAWNLSQKLEEAYVAFLKEYPPAIAVLREAQQNSPFKPVSKEYMITKQRLKAGFSRHYTPLAKLSELIQDIRTLGEAREEALSKRYQGREDLQRYLLTCGLESGNPEQIRECVKKLGDRLNAKERKLFLDLCGPEDDTPPIVIEIPGKDPSQNY
jgi:transcriptional regulator with XRE-family HTH domain